MRAVRLFALSLALERLGTLIAIVVLSRVLTLIDLVYRAFNRALRLLMRLVHILEVLTGSLLV